LNNCPKKCYNAYQCVPIPEWEGCISRRARAGIRQSLISNGNEVEIITGQGDLYRLSTAFTERFFSEDSNVEAKGVATVYYNTYHPYFERDRGLIPLIYVGANFDAVEYDFQARAYKPNTIKDRIEFIGDRTFDETNKRINVLITAPKPGDYTDGWQKRLLALLHYVKNSINNGKACSDAESYKINLRMCAEGMTQKYDESNEKDDIKNHFTNIIGEEKDKGYCTRILADSECNDDDECSRIKHIFCGIGYTKFIELWDCVDTASYFCLDEVGEDTRGVAEGLSGHLTSMTGEQSAAEPPAGMTFYTKDTIDDKLTSLTSTSYSINWYAILFKQEAEMNLLKEYINKQYDLTWIAFVDRYYDIQVDTDYYKSIRLYSHWNDQLWVEITLNERPSLATMAILKIHGSETYDETRTWMIPVNNENDITYLSLPLCQKVPQAGLTNTDGRTEYDSWEEVACAC